MILASSARAARWRGPVPIDRVRCVGDRRRAGITSPPNVKRMTGSVAGRLITHGYSEGVSMTAIAVSSSRSMRRRHGVHR
ncbi:hypothetical protein BDI4_120162 [Burkholderia diffusa]|nr:hypothetical protein BDI4_120162 [Burkholderia diffusa]